LLAEEGLMAKEEEYTNKIGYSERTDAVIEPRLSMQWFMKMKEMAQPALENVMNDNIGCTRRSSRIPTVTGWKM